MVEVGGALGPSFEAQAVNLSEEGMQLRTAYLPEVGQPVRCRFDAGHGMTVVAQGEVLWNEDMGDGGEFGIRFTNLDGPSTVALQRIMGMIEEGGAPPPPEGRKVRLHIDGLASPMRARVRGQKAARVTAYSELGFLQVGKPLEIEDATDGNRRPASIDRVEVEIEQMSRIPQLVVTMRYDDEQARADEEEEAAHAASADEIPIDETTGRDGTPEGMQVESDLPAPAASAAAKMSDAAIEEESQKLKSAFARGAAKVGPALAAWAKRAKTTIALLAAKRGGGSGDDVEIPMRRTTAPPPGGGLHASGRKVIRGEPEPEKIEVPKHGFKMTKRKLGAIGTIGVATILAFVAFRKPSPAPQLASAPPPETTAPASRTPAAPTAATTAAVPVQPDPLVAAAASIQNGMLDTGSKRGKPAPFGNGPVGAHGSTVKIRMDGQIDRILGAPSPTGFTVVLPGRKSLDSASPIASKDPRIAALRVANEANGVTLDVTFKDGVPNYQVRAKGDTLEMTLAKGEKNADAHSGKKKPHKKHH
jgi:hypothetical protein